MSSPDITVYFLGASRAIRIPWLLEELQIPYDLVVSNRAPNGLAPPEFKEKIPAPLRKSPTIKDGDLVVQESGAIVQYLVEKYDTSHKLLPTDPKQRYKAYEWLNAAEGTFMLHALSILYSRWRLPEEAQKYLPELEKALSVNIHNDLNWLENELKQNGTDFLVGNNLTVADIMMQFTVEFIFARKLGTTGGNWPEVEKWLKRTQERQAYKTAVEKTGYTLDSKGQFKT